MSSVVFPREPRRFPTGAVSRVSNKARAECGWLDPKEETSGA